MIKQVIFSVLATVIGSLSSAGFYTESQFELRYCGTGNKTEQTETINYSRKEVQEYSISGNLPLYIMSDDNPAGCANVAGAVIIGYYDRFCENLVPNVKTYVQLGNFIRYTKQTQEISDLIGEFADLMGSNDNGAGTTINGFHRGMRAYVSGKGYNYSYNSVGNLSFSSYKNAVENNKPVAIFLRNYSLLKSTGNSDEKDNIVTEHSTIAHVVVGCGYRVDTYYNSNNNVIASRTYLKVSDGADGMALQYLAVSGSAIENAYAINIV